MNMNRQGSPVIVALDYADPDDALALVARLEPSLCRVKIGKELFTAAGPDLVRAIVGRGFDVFLDMKFHDIPNTVAGAVKAAAALGVWMVNVHASGGGVMMRAAREALGQGQGPLLIAVTVLTSMSTEDLAQVGVNGSAEDQVRRLAGLARESGMDGVVCSSRETRMLRAAMPDDFCLVTPGIRPRGDAADDQKRIATPDQALQDGSDFLVIGRPVTQAADPTAKLREILSSLSTDS